MTGQRLWARRLPVVLRLGLLLLAGTVASCAQAPTTGAAVGTAVAEQFARLYVREQTLLDRTGFSTTGVAASATCNRGGAAPADRGAGDDWTCTVLYIADSSPARTQYELTVTADGCYRATGPLSVAARLSLPDGGATTNPVHAFDGCTSP